MNITATRTITITAAALAIVTAGVLVGCTSQATDTTPKASHSTSSTAPSASASPAAVEGDFDGDGRVTPWDLEQLAKQSYTLPDGSKVAIPTDKPLPAPVVQAVQTAVNSAAGPAVKGDADIGGARARAVIAAAEAQSEKINRTIIPVTYLWAGDTGRFEYGVGGAASGSYHSSVSEAEAVANAQAWIGAQTDKYVVIVFK